VFYIDIVLSGWCTSVSEHHNDSVFSVLILKDGALFVRMVSIHLPDYTV